MKKLLIISLVLLGSLSAQAKETGMGDFNNEDELFETIAGGDEAFEFIRYSPEFVSIFYF